MTEQFLAQYYSAAPAVPRLVVAGPALRERVPVVAEALSARRGGPVEVRVAERGTKRRLRDLAQRNAALALAQDRLRQSGAAPSASTRCQRSRTSSSSRRCRFDFEGFDISNIGGEHTVASMVVFEGGAPRKSDYRRFRCAATGRRVPTTSPRSRRCSVVGVAQLLEQADRSPRTTPAATRASRRFRT